LNNFYAHELTCEKLGVVGQTFREVRRNPQLG
jgi:hypothetical protein